MREVLVRDFGFSIMQDIPILLAADSAAANRKMAVENAAAMANPGDWAEFGVWKGDTARWMLPHLAPDAHLHLFDSYKGLQRDWSALPAGSFAVDTPPTFDDPRVIMHNGWFHDTAPQALADCNLTFIHIDCDLYESTLDALWSLPPLAPGTMILFDEYVHNLGNKPVDDEHRAFTEWVTNTGYPYMYLWRTAWTQVAVEIQ